MILQFILPVAAMIILFVLVQYLTKKNLLNNNVFIRVRILLGCMFVGFLFTEIFQAESIQSMIKLTVLAGICLYGIYILQKKYFVIKNSA